MSRNSDIITKMDGQEQKNTPVPDVGGVQPAALQILDKKLDASLDEEKARKRTSLIQNVYTDLALQQMRKISTQTFSPVNTKDENQERGNWSNPIEFLLSCLGYIVGLGNIWRFPYLVYRNGGGAFFIPYFLMLFLCGVPMVLMELSLGQYWSQGALTLWKIAPMFKGIGISMVIICFFCIVYYCMITGWALYYLIFSLRLHLPWSCCQLPWATKTCISFVQNTSTCSDANWNNTEEQVWTNRSRFAADLFFHNEVLKISKGLDEVGMIQWPMLVALAIAWFICFLVLIRGVKSLGKFSYVTATLPYAVLLTLLIRAVMEPGAKEGIIFYLTPKWHVLKEARVWGDAASQIFYSTGVCFGGVITLSSYNQFKHNIYRDALILGVGNSFTSLFSGLVVFSILGFMADSQNTTVAEVVTSGPGLTFIAYPQAVTLLGTAPVWSVLFFIMLSLLALSSMFPMVENISTALIDQFPGTLRPFKFWVGMAVCIVSFLLGLVLTTNGGMYILQLFDTYAVGRSLLFVGLAEVVLVAWRYNAERLRNNIEMMIGPHPSLVIWKYIWIVATPALLVFAIIFTLIQEKPLEYGDYVFPAWGMAIGWSMTAVTVLPIPIYAIIKLIQHRTRRGQQSSFVETIGYLTLPKDAQMTRVNV